MKHTPGPWTTNECRKSTDPDFMYSHAVYAGNKPICATAFRVGNIEQLPDPEQHANAPRLAEYLPGGLI